MVQEARESDLLTRLCGLDDAQLRDPRAWFLEGNRSSDAVAKARLSAVLVLFVGPESTPSDPRDDHTLLLVRRQSRLRRHAGQVAFPGGRIEPVDQSPEAAALRETVEETGLDVSVVTPVRVLPPWWLRRSSDLITPILGSAAELCFTSKPDPNEVAEVLHISIRDLIDPRNRFVVRSPSGFLAEAFEVGDVFIWGFTARLLAHLCRLGGLEQPWDDTRVRLVPPAFRG